MTISQTLTQSKYIETPWEIISTPSMEIVKETLSTADDKTLVIFDVDEVLLTPKDTLLQRKYRDYLMKKALESSIEYLAIQKRETLPINQEIAELQLQILEMEGRWVSDDVSLTMLMDHTSTQQREAVHG